MAPESDGRPVIFGEVLFDAFPDGNRVLGGAPFNVAWHLQAFGARPLLVSRVGDDEEGRIVRERMAGWGMDLAGLQTDNERSTGAVAVSYEGGEPSYEILPGQAYDFIDAGQLPAVDGCTLLYHGSLALREPASRAALEALKAAAGAPVFIDVNLRDPWWDAAEVESWVAEARWAKLNEDELVHLGSDGGDLFQKAGQRRRRSGLDTLILTRGARGAVAKTAKGEVVEVVPEPDGAPVVDSVGAGDAFASVIILGLLRGWPLMETMERAQRFASAMVHRQGATVDDPAFYAEISDMWGRM